MSRYETDLFEPPPDPELICGICRSVLDTPQETPCRHVFCDVCIKTWLNNKHTCPSCRSNLQAEDLRPVMPMVQNLLNRLTMKCGHHEEGCKDKVPLETYESHSESCGYRLVACSFTRCNQKVTHRSLDEHQLVCEWKEVMCRKKCGLLVLVRDQHRHDCVQALVNRVAEQSSQLQKLKERERELEKMKQDLEKQLQDVGRELTNARHENDFSALRSYASFHDDSMDSLNSYYSEYTVDDIDYETQSSRMSDNSNNENESGREIATDERSATGRSLASSLLSLLRDSLHTRDAAARRQSTSRVTADNPDSPSSGLGSSTGQGSRGDPRDDHDSAVRGVAGPSTSGQGGQGSADDTDQEVLDIIGDGDDRRVRLNSTSSNLFEPPAIGYRPHYLTVSSCPIYVPASSTRSTIRSRSPIRSPSPDANIESDHSNGYHTPDMHHTDDSGSPSHTSRSSTHSYQPGPPGYPYSYFDREESHERSDHNYSSGRESSGSRRRKRYSFGRSSHSRSRNGSESSRSSKDPHNETRRRSRSRTRSSGGSPHHSRWSPRSPRDKYSSDGSRSRSKSWDGYGKDYHRDSCESDGSPGSPKSGCCYRSRSNSHERYSARRGRYPYRRRSPSYCTDQRSRSPTFDDYKSRSPSHESSRSYMTHDYYDDRSRSPSWHSYRSGSPSVVSYRSGSYGSDRSRSNSGEPLSPRHSSSDREISSGHDGERPDRPHAVEDFQSSSSCGSESDQSPSTTPVKKQDKLSNVKNARTSCASDCPSQKSRTSNSDKSEDSRPSFARSSSAANVQDNQSSLGAKDEGKRSSTPSDNEPAAKRRKVSKEDSGASSTPVTCFDVSDEDSNDEDQDRSSERAKVGRLSWGIGTTSSPRNKKHNATKTKSTCNSDQNTDDERLELLEEICSIQHDQRASSLSNQTLGRSDQCVPSGSRSVRPCLRSQGNCTLSTQDLEPMVQTLGDVLAAWEDAASGDTSDTDWEPRHGEDEESDISIPDDAEQEEPGSDYEVPKFKTAAQLLNEYDSDESDASWVPSD